MKHLLAATLLLVCCACGFRETHAAAAVIDEQYPADITPPAGTQYPCALTALPRELPGIPEADRSYINRTYARVLRATQAKLVVLKALEENRRVDEAMKRYESTTSDIGATLKRDAVPAGLEPFRDDLVAALELQQTFFRKGVPLRKKGETMQAVYAVPEGRAASARLFAAWAKMQSRYPSWNAETKDSIFHHLCALDLF